MHMAFLAKAIGAPVARRSNSTEDSIRVKFCFEAISESHRCVSVMFVLHRDRKPSCISSFQIMQLIRSILATIIRKSDKLQELQRIAKALPAKVIEATCQIPASRASCLSLRDRLHKWCDCFKSGLTLFTFIGISCHSALLVIVNFMV
jgi:hypothetical protein